MLLESHIGLDVGLFVLVGLLGGAHCIGMCGPLVTVYASRMDRRRADGGTEAGTVSQRERRRQSHLSVYEVRQHALFNLGRAASYTLLGALMGALGGLVFLTADRFTEVATLVRGVVGIGIGAVVIAVGLRYVAGRGSVGVTLPGADRVTAKLTAWVDRLASGPGIVGLGAVHGLLPCPILYPAYLYAFSTGSAVTGGLALAALGVGTIPAVFAYGTVIESVDVAHRERVHRLLGVVFVVLGYVLLAHGLMSVGVHVPHPMLPFWDGLETPATVAIEYGVMS